MTPQRSPRNAAEPRKKNAASATPAPVVDPVADLERLLKQRAAALSERVLEVEPPSIFGTVIVARRLGSVLGVPIDAVREVRQVRVHRLPRTTASIVGLFQLRGLIHVLVDATPIVGASTPLAHRESTRAIVIEREGRYLGIRVDEIVGPRLLRHDELDRSHVDRQVGLVAEVTHDCVEILDVDAVFHEPAFQMSQRP